MKKIFVAAALFAFIGSGTAATLVAVNTDTKVELTGGEKEKDKKEKKKKAKKGCCAPKTTEASTTEKKGCCTKGNTSSNSGSCQGKTTEQK